MEAVDSQSSSIVDEPYWLKTPSRQLRDHSDGSQLGMILIGMSRIEKRFARYPQLSTAAWASFITTRPADTSAPPTSKASILHLDDRTDYGVANPVSTGASCGGAAMDN